ncbi:M48 family metalloprotease [Pseudonocardia halophobica]|uniref:M48 family metalloprotease n=1 Tax=Pseudonocardia halophobica TaxID=29401 RepID=UPI003D89EB6A
MTSPTTDLTRGPMATVPRVLALPSSTTLRMLLVAAALLVTAMFVGTAVYNALLGQAWTGAYYGCLPTGAVLPSSTLQLRCTAPEEARRAWFALGAAGVAVLLAAIVVLAVPLVVARRQGLRAPGPGYARGVEAVAALAGIAGVPVPGVLIRPGSRGQPFCLGRPGRHMVVLPRKLALRGDPATFDAQVGHEIAHLRHRDVTLSWLARSLWYVLGPLLALPVVLALVQASFGLALEIAWRAIVLIAVVAVLIRGLLRAREPDADLRAAELFGAGPVLDAVLARQSETVGRQSFLAWHPSATYRRQVLADPSRAAAIGALDGMAIGFLVAVALPLVHGVVSAAFLSSGVAGLPELVAASTVGALAGAAIGLGLWRDALAARSGVRRTGTRATAAGVLGGALLGQLPGLAGVGLGSPQVLLLLPLMLCGAAVLTGGLGELWAAGAGGTRGPWEVGLPAALCGAAATIVATWAAPQAELLLLERGWADTAAWLTTAGALVLPIVVTIGLASAAAWALRPRASGTPPRWWGGSSWAPPRPRGLLVTGIVAGVVAAAVPVLFRLTAGPPATDADAVARFDATIFGGGLLAAAVVLMFGMLRGGPGVGAALAVAPVAALLGGAGLLVAVAMTGGNPGAVAFPLLGGVVGSGSVLMLAAAPLLLLVPGRPSGPILAVGAATVVLGLAAVGGVLLERATVVPGLPTDLTSAPGQQTPAAPSTNDPLPEVADPVVPRAYYRDVVARPLLEGRKATADAFRQLQQEKPSNAVAATRIRTEILPVLEQMADAADSVRLDDPEVQEIHDHARDGAHLQVQGFEEVATALERNDRALLQHGNSIIAIAGVQWEEWARGVQTL